jgi:hypothetical protein
MLQYDLDDRPRRRAEPGQNVRLSQAKIVRSAAKGSAYSTPLGTLPGAFVTPFEDPRPAGIGSPKGVKYNQKVTSGTEKTTKKSLWGNRKVPNSP